MKWRLHLAVGAWRVPLELASPPHLTGLERMGVTATLLTLTVLAAGEEAVARGAEAAVTALGVAAGVLTQGPHPTLVQVWSGRWWDGAGGDGDRGS